MEIKTLGENRGITRHLTYAEASAPRHRYLFQVDVNYEFFSSMISSNVSQSKLVASRIIISVQLFYRVRSKCVGLIL
ncbi:unnamed protein product [Thelazia callipaeda]|uniref:Uncharacterized protein n=1 Tax=Thelazia callipaeda TaxID=103827 RepID=A0A0N5D1Y0_THECL|nr:unnamed protein product [Thelazia callipaeda]